MSGQKWDHVTIDVGDKVVLNLMGEGGNWLNSCWWSLLETYQLNKVRVS